MKNPAPAGSSCLSGRDEVMKKLMAAVVLGVALVALTGCTDADKQEAVEPVVREVIESLLAPVTVDNVNKDVEK